MKLDFEFVNRVKDADGAICHICKVFFTIETCQYWHWTKSRALHERGCGHKMKLFRYLFPKVS